MANRHAWYGDSKTISSAFSGPNGWIGTYRVRSACAKSKTKRFFPEMPDMIAAECAKLWGE